MKKLLTIISSFVLGVLVYFIPSSQLDAQIDYCQYGIESAVCEFVPPFQGYFGAFYCVDDPGGTGCGVISC
jgi:hypothetical protein